MTAHEKSMAILAEINKLIWVKENALDDGMPTTGIDTLIDIHMEALRIIELHLAT